MTFLNRLELTIKKDKNYDTVLKKANKMKIQWNSKSGTIKIWKMPKYGRVVVWLSVNFGCLKSGFHHPDASLGHFSIKQRFSYAIKPQYDLTWLHPDFRTLVPV